MKPHNRHAPGDRLRQREHRKDQRIVQLRRALDERDETIRLLNEALSRALDELGLRAA